MKKAKKDKHFVKSPYFEGGRSAMDAYVKKELRYPKEALTNKIEGSVSIQYTVDYKGKVINARVISGIGHGCNEEALRIVLKLPFKVPDQGKIKSKYSRKIHIHFRLPGSGPTINKTAPINKVKNPSTAPSSGMQIQYQVTTTKNKAVTPKTKSSHSYQIKISIPQKSNKK